MTSYYAQTRYAERPDQWQGSTVLRFATSAEAEASLAPIIAGYPNLVETRIVESPFAPTDDWVIAPNGQGYACPRGRKDGAKRMRRTAKKNPRLY